MECLFSIYLWISHPLDLQKSMNVSTYFVGQAFENRYGRNAKCIPLTDRNLEIRWKKNTYAFIFWSFNLTPRCEIYLLGGIPSQIQRKIWFLIRAKCSSICGNDCGAFHKEKHCSHKEKPEQYLYADVKFYPVCIWNRTRCSNVCIHTYQTMLNIFCVWKRIQMYRDL